MSRSDQKIITDSFAAEAFFLDTGKGGLFSLYISPVVSIKGTFLFIPPFMEEMNRSRDLVASQARSFASIGYGCLILDLFGTGDSEGELINADWLKWKNNAISGIEWLEKRTGTKPVLWGLRLGCLLAADLMSQNSGRLRSLLLWQPVINGKQYLTQILRLRMAYLLSHDRPPEKTEDMRKTLETGGGVEIAGYQLPGPLAIAIDEIKLSGFSRLKDCRIDWFENVDDFTDDFSIAVQKTIGEIKSMGADVFMHPYQSPKFWEMSDRVYAPDLIEKTTELYRMTL